MDESTEVPFIYKKVFASDDIMSQFITVLIHIHSNLTLCHDYLGKVDLEEKHPDSLLYFLANLMGHTREAVETINLWAMKEKAVSDFIDANDLRTELEGITSECAPDNNSITRSFLYNTRNRIFHYTKPHKSSELKQAIEDVSSIIEETKITFEPNGRALSMKVAFSRDLITNIIGAGMDNGQLQVKMNEAMPVIVKLIHFCTETTGFFLADKGLFQQD